MPGRAFYFRACRLHAGLLLSLGIFLQSLPAQTSSTQAPTVEAPPAPSILSLWEAKNYATISAIYLESWREGRSAPASIAYYFGSLFYMGRYAELVTIGKNKFKEGDASMSLYLYLGRICLLQKKPAKALYFLTRYEEKGGSFEILWKYYYRAYLALGLTEDALLVLKRSYYIGSSALRQRVKKLIPELRNFLEKRQDHAVLQNLTEFRFIVNQGTVDQGI